MGGQRKERFFFFLSFSSSLSLSLSPLRPLQTKTPNSHAASAARADEEEARVSSEAALIAARLLPKENGNGNGNRGESERQQKQQKQKKRPPRCWPLSSLAEIEAKARAGSRRCVMWDDGGDEGFCCWVRWDWEKGVPLEMKKEEGNGQEEKLGDASWWEVLSRSLGPPLVPSERLEPSRVGEWLDRHTMKVHWWSEKELKEIIEREEAEREEVPLPER